MTEKKTKGDILIAGGGIAGLTLGILLAKAGMAVHLVDKAPPAHPPETKPSGRTVALMESSLNIIRAAGVWDKISGNTSPIRTMRIIDDNAKPVSDISFPASEIGQDQFGFNVPNSILRAALFDAAQKTRNLMLHAPASLETCRVTDSGALARLDNGTELSVSLVAGADGRESAVRRIANIDVKDHDYGQSAITCLIRHALPHNNTACEFHRPSGPLALVPMPGNLSSVVWIERTERAQSLMRLKKDEFTLALQKAANNLLGTLELEANPECWPLKSVRAVRLTAPRMVLLAEAAHVISPITAQGLNLSLRDVAALAETLLDAARAGIDIGAPSILASYEKRREPDTRTRILGVDGMNRIVSNAHPFLRDMRRAGIKTLGTLKPLKKIAMRIALAPSIDQGRLARGEKL